MFPDERLILVPNIIYKINIVFIHSITRPLTEIVHFQLNTDIYILQTISSSVYCTQITLKKTKNHYFIF